jgi:hypothetical protein
LTEYFKTFLVYAGEVVGEVDWQGSADYIRGPIQTAVGPTPFDVDQYTDHGFTITFAGLAKVGSDTYLPLLALPDTNKASSAEEIDAQLTAITGV